MHVVSARERFGGKFGTFVTEAQCPFCRKVNTVSDGRLIMKCDHYFDRAHGCGGEVFKFKQEEGDE
jgi:hypothetical protein